MKCIVILTSFLCLCITGMSQQINLVAPLPDVIQESSGLLYLNGKIITHNDSGGKAVLYELDHLSGAVIRKVTVRNATNIDWEDLCHDDTYIYIADIGNNNGTRTDLKIYRIAISDYFSTIDNTVTAEIISFRYSDQTDFSSKPLATNFDAEALISRNDNLYIFTKNWKDNNTNIYELPKTVGTHQASKTGSIDSQGLVTGATFNSLDQTVTLSGYTFSESFIVEISNSTNNTFSNGIVHRYPLQIPSGFSYQAEGIVYIHKNEYYLTSEKSFSGNAGLFTLDYDNTLGINTIKKKSQIIYHTPSTHMIHTSYKELAIIEIYDIHGRLQKTSTKTQISIADLSQGIYVIILKNMKGIPQLSKKVIVH